MEELLSEERERKTELFSCPRVLGTGCIGGGTGKGCDGGGTREVPWRSPSMYRIPVLPHSICLSTVGFTRHPSPGGHGSLSASYTFSSSFQGHVEQPCSQVQTVRCASCRNTLLEQVSSGSPCRPGSASRNLPFTQRARDDSCPVPGAALRAGAGGVQAAGNEKAHHRPRDLTK